MDGRPWGSLSSWQDADDNRWVVATVWGPSGRDGSLAAFRLAEKDGKPALAQVWASGKLVRPSPPVIASGVVFALANGDGQTHAVLHALDGSNGKELWSTGSGVSAPGDLTGLTVANGRVYFATADGTMWVYGIPLEW